MERVGNLETVGMTPWALERYKSRDAEDWALVTLFVSLCHRYFCLGLITLTHRKHACSKG
jgi:hypothetical protein